MAHRANYLICVVCGIEFPVTPARADGDCYPMCDFCAAEDMRAEMDIENERDRDRNPDYYEFTEEA